MCVGPPTGSPTSPPAWSTGPSVTTSAGLAYLEVRAALAAAARNHGLDADGLAAAGRAWTEYCPSQTRRVTRTARRDPTHDLCSYRVLAGLCQHPQATRRATGSSACLFGGADPPGPCAHPFLSAAVSSGLMPYGRNRLSGRRSIAASTSANHDWSKPGS